MKISIHSIRSSANSRWAFLAIYVALIFMIIQGTYNALEDMLEKNSEVLSLNERLASLASRSHTPSADREPINIGPIFFEDSTPRLAMARFQKEISSIIGVNAGTVTSIQVGSSEEGKSDDLRLVVTFEVVQSRLHQLVYKIEIHRPFVFIRGFNVKLKEEQGVTSGDRVLLLVLDLGAVWRTSQP